MRVPEPLKSSRKAGEQCPAGLVSSSQNGVHPRLQQILQRHLDRPWSQPLHQPSVEAYQHLQDECSFAPDQPFLNQPFILDAGCGTGKSTQTLANNYPGHLVIGVDRSQARLAKSGMSQNAGIYRRDNCVLLRADLPTFWRLLARDGHIPHKQYLLYPNPWPKPGHLQRRWHGHPVFPCLLAVGGEIEMRCNWDIYAQEFAQAAAFVSGVPITVKKYQPLEPLSLFEQKYFERGQSLFRVTIPVRVTNA